MIQFQLAAIKDKLGATYISGDIDFESVSIDSRTILPGEVFIAIKGPHFDGHRFIEQAADKGAAAFIVSEPVKTSLPYLIVPDTRIALGQLAALKRQQVDIPILAVTGSCGKTTTKSMMAAILHHCGHTHASAGTMNNDYGVPLTLMKLTDSHQYAVIEMGANHFEEIAYLTELAKPTVAMITNAGPVHLEGFGNVYGVAQAKGEIFRGLTEQGVAIINADDEQADYWQQLVIDHRKLTFGTGETADIRASNISINDKGKASFTLHLANESIFIQLPLLGQHNVYNALAAAAATFAAGASKDAIKKGLEHVPEVNKRLIRRQGIKGAVIIDDTYNANPTGVKAALEVLSKCQGKKIFVMGSMGELGDLAPEYHHELGEKAHDYGVEQLFAVGDLTHFTVSAFGKGGHHFSKQSELIEILQTQLGPDTHVLIKGSRATQMENVVEALLTDEEQEHC